MSQVGATAGAQGFGADHAVAAIDPLDDGPRARLPKARPATAGVEFGVAVEQMCPAADAVMLQKVCDDRHERAEC